MSYRPSNQEIAPHLEAIIEVLTEKIPEISSAIIQRSLSGEWKQSHISEMNKLQWELMEMRAALKRVEEGTW